MADCFLTAAADALACGHVAFAKQLIGYFSGYVWLDSEHDWEMLLKLKVAGIFAEAGPIENYRGESGQPGGYYEFSDAGALALGELLCATDTRSLQR